MRNNLLQRVLIIALVIALVLGMGGLVYNKLSQMQDLAAQLSEQEEGLRQDENRLVQLKLLMAEGEELEEQYERSEMLIPDNPEEEKLIRYLQEKSADAGVDFVEIKFNPRIQAEKYLDMPIEIAFSGDYDSLIQFLRNIFEGERAVRIDTINVAASGDGTNDIRADIGAHSFSRKKR